MSEDDSFFAGGDKVAGFVIGDTPGVRLGGRVLEVGKPVQAREVLWDQKTQRYETGDPKEWPSGDPIMQRRVVCQTQLRENEEDDGRRAFFMEQGKEITKAMMAAVEAVRGKGKSMPQVGGDLWMTFTGTDPGSYKQSKKLFRGEYTAAIEDPWSTSEGYSQGYQAPAGQEPQGGPPPPPWAAAPTPPPAAQGGGWGQQPAPAAAPAAPAQYSPPSVPAPAAGVDPQLVAFLASKGVTVGPEMTEGTARMIASTFTN